MLDIIWLLVSSLMGVPLARRPTRRRPVESHADSQVIENIVTYVTLAEYNNEQSDMLHKLYADPALEKAPIY